MSPSGIGWIVMGCVFGGAMLGMTLRMALPEHHLSSDSKDVIKLAMGLTATMSALVLALLIASAKTSYDAQRNEMDADFSQHHFARPGRCATGLRRRMRAQCCGVSWLT